MAIDGSITLVVASLSGTALVAARYTGDVDLPGLDMGLGGSMEPPKALPSITLAAVGVVGAAASGRAVAPSLTSAGLMTNGPAMAGSIELPGFTLLGGQGLRGVATLYPVSLEATGVAGAVSKGPHKTPTGATINQTNPILPPFALAGAGRSNPFGQADITPLAFSLAAAGVAGSAPAGDVRLPFPLVEAAGIAGRVPAGAVALPGATLTGTMVSGNIGHGASTAPSLSLAGAVSQRTNGTGTGAITTLGATLSAVGLVGSLSQGAIQPLPLTLSATSANHAPASGSATLAAFSVAAQANTSGVGEALVSLDPVRLSATALTGEVATASLEVPLFSVSGTDGNLSIIGTATIGLPAFTLSALAQNAPVLASVTFTGINLNSRTRAVSTYEGMAPNSAARFQNVTLLATADGIVALAGDTDLGDPIDAYFTSGKSRMGGDGVQRVLTGYIGYRADGDLELTLITDDHHENVYVLVPRRLDDQHTSRMKFGRGVKGTYWQFKLANVDGSDFSIDRIELHPASTGSKV